MVRGTRETVRALMRDGQNLLVFPGGAREVFKARGQEYQLLWKERVGFARLAIEFGYPIVPFAAVGAEEMFEVLIDDRTPVAAQVSALMRRLVGLPLPPLSRGVGLTALPRPERLYFWFGEPVETARWAGDKEEAARAVRDRVKAAVEEGIEKLFVERERDPHRGLWARLRGEEADLPQLATEDPKAWLVTRAFEAWNSSGPAAAAAWMSRRVQLTDPPGVAGASTWRGRHVVAVRLEQIAAELGVSSVEVTDARSLAHEVLVVFALRRRLRSGAQPSTLAALVAVEDDQIVRLRVFFERREAIAAAKGAPQSRRRRMPAAHEPVIKGTGGAPGAVPGARAE